MYELDEGVVRIKLEDGKSLLSDHPINTSYDAVHCVADFLKTADREYVIIINIDTKGHPINYNIVNIGTLNNSDISISNIFKAALLSNAAGFILVHNHPSGDLTPSEKDHDVTQQIATAGRIMGIPMEDHIIVGPDLNKYYSIMATNNTVGQALLQYDDNQLEQIRIGLEEGLDIDTYSNLEFDANQMKKIREGLEEGLDVSKYADLKYNWKQMLFIQQGLKDGVDVSWYTDPKFTDRQIQQWCLWGSKLK